MQNLGNIYIHVQKREKNRKEYLARQSYVRKNSYFKNSSETSLFLVISSGVVIWLHFTILKFEPTWFLDKRSLKDSLGADRNSILL